MADIEYDVVIAGGGIAGAAAAAALREFNFSVLVVEPGQHSERRLGGELIHPAGVSALKELGLFDERAFGRGVSIAGFVALPGLHDDWSDIHLPYASDWGPRNAIALDHGTLRATLWSAIEAMPHVTTIHGGRVVGVDNSPTFVRVAIQQGARSHTVTARLLIAADGASSAVRSLAGIKHKRRPISTITGYLISDANLPHPGFGHVFMGGAAPLLVYEIGNSRARVLFDQPVGQSAVPCQTHQRQIVSCVPYPRLRAEIEAAMADQRGLRFVSVNVVVARSAQHRMVLMGDAGGSCHPLTATGMTVGIIDALRLRDTLRSRNRDIPAAIALYGRLRRAPQRTRHLVASALHDACSSTGSEQMLIRDGLVNYWRRSPRGRQASMAILAMSDYRIGSVLREILTVMSHGIAARWTGWSFGGVLHGLRMISGLTGVLIRQVSFAIRVR